MYEVPKEVIWRHASHKVAEYFAEKVFERRKKGFVPVLIEDFYDSLYFMPCNSQGYPDYYRLRALEVPRYPMAFLTDGDIPTGEITVNEIEIVAKHPLVMGRGYDLEGYPYVFLWSGEKVGTERIPIEKLDVKELMRVAQVAIKNREGLIVDEALRNKIYK